MQGVRVVGGACQDNRWLAKTACVRAEILVWERSSLQHTFLRSKVMLSLRKRSKVIHATGRTPAFLFDSWEREWR